MGFSNLPGFYVSFVWGIRMGLFLLDSFFLTLSSLRDFLNSFLHSLLYSFFFFFFFKSFTLMHITPQYLLYLSFLKLLLLLFFLLYLVFFLTEYFSSEHALRFFMCSVYNFSLRSDFSVFLLKGLNTFLLLFVGLKFLFSLWIFYSLSLEW